MNCQCIIEIALTKLSTRKIQHPILQPLLLSMSQFIYYFSITARLVEIILEMLWFSNLNFVINIRGAIRCTKQLNQWLCWLPITCSLHALIPPPPIYGIFSVLLLINSLTGSVKNISAAVLTLVGDQTASNTFYYIQTFCFFNVRRYTVSITML